MGAVYVNASSVKDSSSSSSIGPELTESDGSLSSAARNLIGKSKMMPAFPADETEFSAGQLSWLADRLEGSGLTRIVCTGLTTNSMTTHQRIQVRKLAKATCAEAAQLLGESSVWYQSKLTSAARHVGKVMITFKDPRKKNL
jgi:hypothetical protein